MYRSRRESKLSPWIVVSASDFCPDSQHHTFCKYALHRLYSQTLTTLNCGAWAYGHVKIRITSLDVVLQPFCNLELLFCTLQVGLGIRSHRANAV